MVLGLTKANEFVSTRAVKQKWINGQTKYRVLQRVRAVFTVLNVCKDNSTLSEIIITMSMEVIVTLSQLCQHVSCGQMQAAIRKWQKCICSWLDCILIYWLTPISYGILDYGLYRKTIVMTCSCKVCSNSQFSHIVLDMVTDHRHSV